LTLASAETAISCQVCIDENDVSLRETIYKADEEKRDQGGTLNGGKSVCRKKCCKSIRRRGKERAKKEVPSSPEENGLRTKLTWLIRAFKHGEDLQRWENKALENALRSKRMSWGSRCVLQRTPTSTKKERTSDRKEVGTRI